MPRSPATLGALLDQTVSPVRLLRATSIASGAPGLNVNQAMGQRNSAQVTQALTQASQLFNTGGFSGTPSFALGRSGQPEEVASAIAFLACEDASYVTGQTLNVSGGLSMW